MKIAEVTEMKIGNTVFTVTAECSDKATETVEQKLKRLILGAARDGDKLIKSCQLQRDPALLSAELYGNMSPTNFKE